MERKEYERVSPESLGIPSKSIQDMVDRLEKVTEMHSIMIQRHGKICAEGWWAPYAPGIPHGLQSLTKTYASTAVGIAFTRGELSLDEKLVDLFPEYLLESVDENLRKLTIYHVLSMTNGMDECNLGGADWINKYFAAPVNHEPGTQFFYNTAGSGMLGVIIKRKTGRSLEQYLKGRL
ncbi:MAG: serine hydrolase domain-containing protein [Eubacteriales bacterium]|nr:serine hydrolase domain-containing protein [Eubacteriales bacterium]